MRRLTAWIGGAIGGMTAYRFLRRRPEVAVEAPPDPWAAERDERAAELRAKLAEARVAEPPAAEPPAAAPIEEPPEPEPETPEERRARVHEEGRAALDEMKPEQP
jgi:hypothetical protein